MREQVSSGKKLEDIVSEASEVEHTRPQHPEQVQTHDWEYWIPGVREMRGGKRRLSTLCVQMH